MAAPRPELRLQAPTTNRTAKSAIVRIPEHILRIAGRVREQEDRVRRAFRIRQTIVCVEKLSRGGDARILAHCSWLLGLVA